jgi:hypothetical protein
MSLTSKRSGMTIQTKLTVLEDASQA